MAIISRKLIIPHTQSMLVFDFVGELQKNMKGRHFCSLQLLQKWKSLTIGLRDDHYYLPPFTPCEVVEVADSFRKNGIFGVPGTPQTAEQLLQIARHIFPKDFQQLSFFVFSGKLKIIDESLSDESW